MIFSKTGLGRAAEGVLCAAVGLVLAGCSREEITRYQVAKEAAPAPAAAESPQAAAAQAPALARPTWKTPAGWEEMPPGEMRLASFQVKGKDGKAADVSVIPLPGLAGSDLDNVNRWRRQVGLEPVKEEDMVKLGEQVEIAGQPGFLFDLSGQRPESTEKARILAALQRREGVAWFFKMTGDPELIGAQKAAFVELLKSFSFPASTGLPPGHP